MHLHEEKVVLCFHNIPVEVFDKVRYKGGDRGVVGRVDKCVVTQRWEETRQSPGQELEQHETSTGIDGVHDCEANPWQCANPSQLVIYDVEVQSLDYYFVCALRRTVSLWIKNVNILSFVPVSLCKEDQNLLTNNLLQLEMISLGRPWL